MFSVNPIQQTDLDPLYHYEIDTVDTEKWSTELGKFDDASIFQTIGYSKHYPGGKDCSKFILRKNGKICSLALVRRKRLSHFQGGMAYIYWGPLWRLCGEPVDEQILLQALKALYTEFVLKQKMYLRITPGFRENQLKDSSSLVKSAHFRFRRFGKRYTTILINMKDSLDVLRKNFRRNWRNHLNRAERNDLDIRCGVDMELYSVFMNLSYDMTSRKNLIDMPDLERYKQIQQVLPFDEKMRIFVCSCRNKPISSAVVTLLGNTGYYLLGATSTEGMHYQGSYLIQWHVLQWLKSCGCRLYDLCGIDPKNNPGVYHFKSGMGGDELKYVDQFHAYQSNILFFMIIAAEMFRGAIKLILSYLNKINILK